MVPSLDILRAASDATRLRVIGLLRSMELSVGELAQVLEQSQPRVSRHIKILCDAGLTVRRKEGSWVFVALGEPALVAPLLEALRTARGITLEPRVRAAFTVRVLEQALAARLAGDTTPNLVVDGAPADEDHLRRSLEAAYRDQAALTTDTAERRRLVDEANRIRPWSWL